MDSEESCARQTKTISFYGFLWDPLWTYKSKTLWCWNGSVITDVLEWTRPPWSQWPWTFVGHLDDDESGGQGQWSHYDYTQGHFRQCFGGDIGCVNDMYPELSKYQYGDGSSS